MGSQNDINNDVDVAHRPKLRRGSYMVASAMALSLAASAPITCAFPTPGPQRPPLSVNKGPQKYHTSISSNNAAFCSSYTIFNGCHSSSTRSAASSHRLQAKSKDASEQEEFQRSLLAAQLTQEQKDTHIKQENERNEIITKQISQEKADLKERVKEVKAAVKDIGSSAKNLGGAVISNSTTVVKEAVVDVGRNAKNLGGAVVLKGPGIFKRVLTLLATGEMR